MKYLLFGLALLLGSCKKEKSCEECVGGIITKNATIIYSGPIETDGCSWLVKIDSTNSFHPDFLGSAFQQDQLPVEITYRLTTDDFICGLAALKIPVIHIVNIQKR